MTTADEKALNAISEFIQSVLPGSMVQKFVLIVEAIDEEDRYMSAYVAPDQRRWDTLGLLAYATAIENNIVRIDEMDDDDDDDPDGG